MSSSRRRAPYGGESAADVSPRRGHPVSMKLCVFFFEHTSLSHSAAAAAHLFKPATHSGNQARSRLTTLDHPPPQYRFRVTKTQNPQRR